LEVLVAYDVATESVEGRRRLRRVAKVCEGYGQRVQKSVFECVVNDMEFEELKHDLTEEIDPAEDSLRIYRLHAPREKYLWTLGLKRRLDLHEPLLL